MRIWPEMSLGRKVSRTEEILFLNTRELFLTLAPQKLEWSELIRG